MSLLTQFYGGGGSSGGGGESTNTVSGALSSILVTESVGFGISASITGPIGVGADSIYGFNTLIVFKTNASTTAATAWGSFSGSNSFSITGIDAKTLIFTNFFCSCNNLTNALTGAAGALGSRLTTVKGFNCQSLNASGITSITGLPGIVNFSNFSLAVGTSGSFTCNGCPALTTMENVYIRAFNTGSTVSIQGAALSATSVNSLLENAASLISAGSSATLNLSGGTSAGVSLLTTAGAAARAALIAAGWTVTLNT